MSQHTAQPGYVEGYIEPPIRGDDNKPLPLTIPDHIERLANRAEELESLTERLVERLAMILVPMRDDDYADGVAALVRPSGSTIADDLDLLEGRLYRISRVIADTTDRVNL